MFWSARRDSHANEAGASIYAWTLIVRPVSPVSPGNVSTTVVTPPDVPLAKSAYSAAV